MLKGLLKDSAVYGVANAVQKLVPFFVVPIVIHQLGQTAFKVYDVSFVYAYLFSWLLILGQDAAASVFYFDDVKTAFNKKQVLGYGLAVQGGAFVIALLFFLPLKNSIARLLFAADPVLEGYWIKALLIIPVHMLLNYTLNILLWQKRKKAYVGLCICQTVFSLAAVYITIVLQHGGLNSLFYCLTGSTAACAIIGFGIIHKELSAGPWPLNTALLRKLVLFGIPFALTSFFHQLLPSIDRYFLLQYGRQQDLPSYILAVKLGGLMGLGIGAFALAFTPYSMARINKDGAEKELSSLFRLVAVAGFAIVPVLLLFKDLMVQLFADSTYAVSAKLLPFFFFGWLFDLFSYFSMLGIYKVQNSVLVLGLFAMGIVLISVLNIVLIPKWGVYGAAMAFCGSKAALFFIPLVYLRRHFKLTLHTRSFFTALGVAVLYSYLLYQVPPAVYIGPGAALVLGTVYYLHRQPFAKALFYGHQAGAQHHRKTL